jgi:hypothetical protein
MGNAWYSDSDQLLPLRPQHFFEPEISTTDGLGAKEGGRPVHRAGPEGALTGTGVQPTAMAG